MADGEPVTCVPCCDPVEKEISRLETPIPRGNLIILSGTCGARYRFLVLIHLLVLPPVLHLQRRPTIDSLQVEWIESIVFPLQQVTVRILFYHASVERLVYSCRPTDVIIQLILKYLMKLTTCLTTTHIEEEGMPMATAFSDRLALRGLERLLWGLELYPLD